MAPLANPPALGVGLKYICVGEDATGGASSKKSSENALSQSPLRIWFTPWRTARVLTGAAATEGATASELSANVDVEDMALTEVVRGEDDDFGGGRLIVFVRVFFSLFGEVVVLFAVVLFL